MYKIRAIYTLSMAHYLAKHGFTPVAEAPNLHDLKKIIWLFDATPEFNAACAEYVAQSRHSRHKTVLAREGC